VDRIIYEIKQIGELYNNTKGLILSESDLKCLIYHRLYRYFSGPIQTMDENIFAVSLHTEVPWYDENGKLTIRPDITILDARSLSIQHGLSIRYKDGNINYDKLPSKGFQFGGDAIIIEIKFIKKLNGITSKDIKKFKVDLNKMKNLRERLYRPDLQNGLKGLLVIFNKTNNYSSDFEDFLNTKVDQSIEIVYCTGNL
jgi:hypothetical protein